MNISYKYNYICYFIIYIQYHCSKIIVYCPIDFYNHTLFLNPQALGRRLKSSMERIYL